MSPDASFPAATPITLDPTQPSLVPPTLGHVYEARARLQGQLPRTPLHRHPLLAAQLGCDVLVKHENHLPTGAFKVRGGLNLLGLLARERPGVSIVTASSGNHGQSIALASQRYGLRCTVYVPVGNNPDKNAAIRAFGATVVEHGRDFDDARLEAERRAAEPGVRYVHSGNEPLLIAGVGTYALELFEDLPDVDIIFVPIGGGSGASGLVTVRDGLNSRARIIGVQAAGADAFAQSWRTGTRVTRDRVDTFAEGVATRTTFDLPFSILASRLEDVVVLTDDELRHGVRLALEATHNLAEGAGAAAIAAAYARRAQIAGRTVACIMSGGNLTVPTLAGILESVSS